MFDRPRAVVDNFEDNDNWLADEVVLFFRIESTGYLLC